MLQNILETLIHPSMPNLDLDAPETTAIRAGIIKKKSFLCQLYLEWYRELISFLPDRISGPVVELGSGGGFINDIAPDIITSDILPLRTVDLVFNACQLPFTDASLRGIVMVDVLHHLPRVKEFFNEATRCLKPGGVIVMIEPWYSIWSGFIYHFHHELFAPDAMDWHFEIGGPLSQANMALPWIVFQRDRKIFDQEFKRLRIKQIRPHTPFSYIFSGGLSIRGLLPGRMFHLCRKMETKLQRWMRPIAMFSTIVLEKKSATPTM